VDSPQQHAQQHTTGESGIVPGMFCQYSGNPSTIIGTYKPIDDEDVDSISNHIELAQKGTDSCAGIVVSDNGGTYSIKDSGIVLAWILRPTKRLLPLSGIYEKSIQGLPSGRSVILVAADGYFVIATSRDNEMEFLIERFNALTNS